MNVEWRYQMYAALPLDRHDILSFARNHIPLAEGRLGARVTRIKCNPDQVEFLQALAAPTLEIVGDKCIYPWAFFFGAPSEDGPRYHLSNTSEPLSEHERGANENV